MLFKNLANRLKNSKGAIIVEATIAFPIFIFVMYIILSITDICYIQSTMNVALNTAAKDISEYSYLYFKFGLDDAQKELVSGTEEYSTLGDETLYYFDQLSKDLSDGAKSVKNADYDGMKSAFESGKANVQGGTNNAQSWVDMAEEDPSAFISGMAQWALSGIVNGCEEELAQSMGKAFTKKNLKNSSNGDVDVFLRHYHVKDASEGLDFTGSSVFHNGTNQIQLICTYKVEVVRLLNLDYDFTFRQMALTKAWACGDSTKTFSSADGDKSNESGEESGDEDTEEEPVKDAAYYAALGTHNPDSSQVMLGKYEAAFTGSYVDNAEQFGMTYFSLDDAAWDEVIENGTSAAWAANEQFLQNQMDAGKTFYTCSDPYNQNGFFSSEIAWLESQGYTFTFDPGTSLWRAEKQSD